MKKILVCLLFFSLLFPFYSCKKQPFSYADYYSEVRGDIYIAEEDDLLVKIYATLRESPYLSDGYARHMQQRTEVQLFGASGETVHISLQLCGEKVEGEMSFDDVKQGYFLHLPNDSFSLENIPISVQREGGSIEMTAKRVEKTLGYNEAFSNLYCVEKEKISSLKKNNYFEGEIRIRLIYESAPYYYIGIIPQEGEEISYLLDANSGKIIAKRQ